MNRVVVKHYDVYDFTAVPVLCVCTFDQSEFNILKLMFLKELLYFDMSVKINKF